MRVSVSVVGLALGGPSDDQSVAQQTDRLWDFDMRNHSTVQDLVDRLGLPADEIQMVLVNGRHADRRTALADGDAVAFTGQVSGD